MNCFVFFFFAFFIEKMCGYCNIVKLIVAESLQQSWILGRESEFTKEVVTDNAPPFVPPAPGISMLYKSQSTTKENKNNN